jgi:hypothetical protein
MMGVPVGLPLAWTSHGVFLLQSKVFGSEMGSDCLLHRSLFR